jgi:NADH dehydrogenase
MSGSAPVDVVTGAFGYSGAAVAAELHRRGRTVRTLTAHRARRAGPGPRIESWPLDFTEENLRACLTGVDTLYNTYWSRFPQTGTTYDAAVANTRTLFRAAAQVGVRRIVHVSITHPDAASPFPYFRGKALVEQDLAGCGVPYAIARPAFLFGNDGVLINNMAWMLRHLPVVPVGDGGTYLMRGMHVADLARLCADLADAPDGACVDAVGPDRMTFRDLLGLVRDAVAPKTPIVAVPGRLLIAGAHLLIPVLRDHLLTGDEYRAMTSGLADSQDPATGTTSFRTWVEQEAPRLGRRYLNDTRGRTIPHSTGIDPVKRP